MDYSDIVVETDRMLGIKPNSSCWEKLTALLGRLAGYVDSQCFFRHNEREGIAREQGKEYEYEFDRVSWQAVVGHESVSIGSGADRFILIASVSISQSLHQGYRLEIARLSQQLLLRSGFSLYLPGPDAAKGLESQGVGHASISLVDRNGHETLLAESPDWKEINLNPIGRRIARSLFAQLDRRPCSRR